jgi:RNA polymerase subunit RPABC4/transcription elongation factor Spt4
MAGKKPVVKECNICGSEIEEDVEYCPECGADFTGEVKREY